jgi:hypothetical protein
MEVLVRIGWYEEAKFIPELGFITQKVLLVRVVFKTSLFYAVM